MRPGNIELFQYRHEGIWDMATMTVTPASRQICATDAASSVVGRSAKPVMTRD